MSVMETIRLDSLSDAHEDAAPTAPGRCPLAGAVLLDQMAAIAGPAWVPDHERAWSAALEVVVGAMRAGASEQRVLTVEFRAAGGRRWSAIGGGATVAAAILDARESCPEDATWEPFSWSDLYGD